MIELGVLVLMLAASVGAGALTLALFGVLDDLDGGERIAWCFAVGLGTMGWLVFVLVLSVGTGPRGLAILSVAAAGGILRLRPWQWRIAHRDRLDGTGLILCAAILVILIFDLLEGMAPPADADTLAYHFTLPSGFLDAGRIYFVPRAVDGAIPMLVHMTYLTALGLGGETVLTLWVMMTTWMAGMLLYMTCRHYLSPNWSLATALLFLSTPAVLYGGGTGQMETRLVLFVLVAAAAMARAVGTGGAGYVAVAGLAAGFYAGAKFTGLLFLPACALPLLMHKSWFRNGAIYGAVALVAGGQWYVWSWVHTGDPVFPTLFSVLGLPDSEFWNAAQHDYFRSRYFAAENSLPIGFLTLLTHPFRAAFGLNPALEAGRTGLGPFVLLILPMAVAGAWHYRRRLKASPLAVLVAIALAFYIIWIMSGTSQRVRHLLPVYPLLLLGVTVAAVRWAEAPGLRHPLVAATGLAIILQLGGQTIFGLNYARHFIAGESREAFLARNVPAYGVVPWINGALGANHKILTTERQLTYLIEIPTLYFHPHYQTQFSLRRAAEEPGKFLQALRNQGITHLLFRYGANDKRPGRDGSGVAGSMKGAVAVLGKFGCARIVKKMGVSYFSSRTLSSRSTGKTDMGVAAITDRGCRL